MSDDWDLDDEPVNSGSSTPAPAAAPVVPKAPVVKKWAGEDEEEDQDDDWDVSEDEKPKATTPTTTAPVKKKMTLKQKLAEKERLAAEAREQGDVDEIMDTRTEQERRREAREREIEADLATAADLMGGATLDDTPEDLFTSIVSSKPTTKSDFTTLSKNVYAALIKRHENNPLFSAFVEQLSKDLCETLTAVQTRKVSSALSVLGNTKQQEERDKASGKKKTTGKPKLGAAKPSSKIDTEAYDDVLDDDDFM